MPPQRKSRLRDESALQCTKPVTTLTERIRSPGDIGNVSESLLWEYGAQSFRLMTGAKRAKLVRPRSVFETGDSTGIEPMDENRIAASHLYLTYAWAQREEADFGYLARQLKGAGFEVTYAPIRLSHAETLWDQILPCISSGEIDGWAYLLTPRCVNDPFCRDSLLAALDRAYEKKGSGFPLLGLLHGISEQSLPPALKLRPCVHLANPNWRDQVKAVFSQRSSEGYTHFLWTIHPAYGGDMSKTAIEVSPRADGLRNWRFAVPAAVRPIRWGHGPAGGGDISPVRFSVAKGGGILENSEIAWFGSEDALSPRESAYAVFSGQLPDFICFGRARTAGGPPGKMEIFRAGLQRQWSGSKAVIMDAAYAERTSG